MTRDPGAFLQTDPVGYEDDLNIYQYVGNDPLNRSDPTGRQTRYENMLMQRDMPPMSARAVENARTAVGVALDLTPGVGDVKGAIETAQNPTPLGVAAVVVGLVPGVGDAGAAVLRNSDLVVRGGDAAGGNSVRGIASGTGTHPSGVTGFSAEASPGASLCDLCSNIPNGQVGVTTVGDVRAAGGDVVQTSGRSPNHVTVTGVSPQEANRQLTPTQDNPVPPGERRFRQ